MIKLLYRELCCVGVIPTVTTQFLAKKIIISDFFLRQVYIKISVYVLVHLMDHQNLPFSQNMLWETSLIFWHNQDECTLVHTQKFQVWLNYTTSSNLKTLKTSKTVEWKQMIFFIAYFFANTPFFASSLPQTPYQQQCKQKKYI